MVTGRVQCGRPSQARSGRPECVNGMVCVQRDVLHAFSERRAPTQGCSARKLLRSGWHARSRRRAWETPVAWEAWQCPGCGACPWMSARGESGWRRERLRRCRGNTRRFGRRGRFPRPSPTPSVLPSRQPCEAVEKRGESPPAIIVPNTLGFPPAARMDGLRPHALGRRKTDGTRRRLSTPVVDSGRARSGILLHFCCLAIQNRCLTPRR